MSEFALERSTTIHAPASTIYPLVADFRQWRVWSPWEGLDPDLERSYSGAESGVGAVYAWSGNRKAGEGRMEITEAIEPSTVVIDLRFLKPFKAQNVTTFALTPAGSDTTVTWKMVGPKPFLARVLPFLLNMDKLVGKDFEKGLAAMKAAAEGAQA